MNKVISIDYGTQSVRVAIINEKGEFLAFEQERYDEPYFSIKPGYCEQNPDYYYEKMCLAAKRLTEKNKELLKGVESISSTCFRDTAVYLDENFNVVRPSIIWLDQRQAKLKRKIPFVYSAAFWLVGMSDTIILNRKRTNALWLQEKEPENREKIRYYVPLNSYFNYRMLGVLGDSASNMIGHFPINFKSGKPYGKYALKGIIFGVDPIMLPKVIKSPGEIIGSVSKKGSEETGFPEGLNYIGTGNDKSCEALGSGAIDGNCAHASLGTSCSIAMIKHKYFEPIKFLPSYICAFKGYYSGEVQVYRGCWMLSWFSKEFAKEDISLAEIEKIAPEELLNREILKISPGSNGLILQPFWGPQLEKPLAKGSIIGFYDVHTKYHMYRSIIEGLCYALKEGLLSIEKRSHQKAKYITIAGGGSKSEAICQICADIFNKPVYKPKNYEASTLGCAMAQFIALNKYNSLKEAKESMITYDKIFYPNKENVKKYEHLFKEVYEKIYPKLKGVYASLNDYLQINNEGTIH